MPLRLREGWTDSLKAGAYWPLPGEPAFASSRALELLRRDLKRYLDEEIAGRSVLVAGHRGAGKTATVIQAWRVLRNDRLRAAADGPLLLGRRGRLQRPLLVKLVGESLIAPPPTLQPDSSTAEGQDQEHGHSADEAQASDQTENGAKPTKPARGKAGAPPPARPAAATDDLAENALVHITIALYRALCGEVAEGFAVHARATPASGRAERMEIAAQLALDLDATPEPAALRQYWDRIGRLDDGVLWPPETAPLLARTDLSGQGYREVMAVATAAQAFQVCSGAVTFRETNIDTARREATSTTTIDLKDLLGRVGALGAGALAGGVVGASDGALPGVGTGLLVWLASGAVLSWTSSRYRKRERNLDYSFLRDRSVGTLDRDLPLVIGRIREAGLAPIFVIDELDKVKDPAGTIKALIDRLKHLVSDYGFFCFLTDRNYYDAIERKVGDEAYPVEHTYFGERLLILNRPQDLFEHVYGLLDSGEPGPSYTAATAALATMFRSKLNFTDLSRELSQLVHLDGTLRLDDQDLKVHGLPRLEATIQLAINEVLAADDIAERFRNDLGFAQLAIDAAYYIVRRWLKDSTQTVDIHATKLETELLGRRKMERAAAADQASPVPQAAGAAAKPAKGEADADTPPPISPPDLKVLAEMVKRLADYLSNFETLRNLLLARAAAPAAAASSGAPGGGNEVPAAMLADIVIENGRLIEPADGSEYRFLLDETGRGAGMTPTPTPPAPALAAPKAADRAKGTPVVGLEGPRPGIVKETSARRRRPRTVPAEPPIAEASAGVPGLLEAVAQLVTATGIRLEDFVSCGLLPPSVGGRAFETILGDRHLADSDPGQADARRRAEDGERGLQSAFDSQGPNLAKALMILVSVMRDTRITLAPSAVLGLISRYLVPGSRSELILPGRVAELLEGARLTGEPDEIRAFARRYQGLYPGPPSGEKVELGVAPDISRGWARWQAQVTDFLRRGNAYFSATIDYEDILMATYGVAPGRLFRSSLKDMDQTDWSRAALAGLITNDGYKEAPYWLLFAALTALRFDRSDLERLSVQQPVTGEPPPDVEFQAIRDLIPLAETGRPRGVLHVFPNPPTGTPPREIPELKPMVSASEFDAERYIGSLIWLAGNELFDEGRDEIG